MHMPFARIAAACGLAAMALLAAPARGQDGEPPARALRFRPAEAAQVTVKKGIVYAQANDPAASLSFDLYTLPRREPSARRLPLVVFVNGVGYRDLKDWAQYTGWATAAACEGLAAVTYQATSNRTVEELDLLMLYLKEHQTELGVDANNVAWWACSDNVHTALPQSMSKARPYLRCAVFYYGMPEQWPAVRSDLALCVVKAGVDDPALNERIDRFAMAAAAANVDLNFLVHASARHAFDVGADSVRTRDVIQDTLKFLRIQLSSEFQAETEAAALDRRARRAFFDKQWTEMRDAYEALAKLKPDNGEAHYRLGVARLFLGEFEKAAPSFERAAELDFLRPSSTYNVACCRSRMGDIEGALDSLRLALERGFENLALMKDDPDLANLRGDPRYTAMLAEWLEKRGSGDQKP